MAALTAPVVGGKGTIELADEVFGHETHRQLLYEAVRAEMLARRQGTSQTKTRGQVAGGAAKPWRQKGTGRARAGTTRSPLWRGGGVTFGPHPRDYGVKMNRKAARRAKLIALSQHAALESLGVFDGATFSSPKTSEAQCARQGLGPAVAARRARGRGGVRRGALVPQPRARDRRLVRGHHGRRAALGAQPAGLAGRAGRAAGRCRVTSVTTDPRHVILEPVVSEKAYNLIQFDKYTFKVHPTAHKTQVRQAIELLFGVHVSASRSSTCRASPSGAVRRPGSGPATRRRSSSCARAIRSSSSRGRARWVSDSSSPPRRVVAS